MLDFLRKKDDECSRFRDSLEEVASGGASREMLEHSAACEDCAAAAEELLESRELLRALPRQTDVRPWFAPRVMAAIATREAELRQSIDAWTIVPKLAWRLTWVSAVALVLASTWFLQRPAAVPSPVATDITGEPVQYSAPVTNDDVLMSLAEKGS
jgi:hypothetical protein